MSWLRTIGSEFLGIFVDDGAFALAIVAWLVACGVLFAHVALPTALPPVILFAGLVVILIDSAVRRAGRKQN